MVTATSTTELAPPSDQRSPLLRYWPMWVALAVIALPHVTLVWRTWRRMWQQEHYQFFPVVLVSVAIVVWLRVMGTDDEWPESKDRVWLRWLLWLVAIPPVAVAVLVDSPWLGTEASMFSLLAVLYHFGGASLTRLLFPAWLLLWFAVPLPLGLDEQLILSMQHVAAGWSSGLLDLMGYRHLISGVVIELPERRFLVEEACSGVHSLFATLSCTAFYLVLTRQSVWRSITLLSLATFWVVVANAIRITAVTVLSTRWNLEVTEGWRHELLGMIVFVGLLLVIASTDRLLMFFVPVTTSERRKELVREVFGLEPKKKKSRRRKTRATAAELPEESASPADVVDPVEQRRSRRLPWPALVYGVLICWQLFFVGSDPVLAKSSPEPLDHTVVTENALPAEWNDWKLVGHESIERDPDDPNGQFSLIWQYQRPGLGAVLSVDGPFVGWHNLGNCLHGQGWDLQRTTNHEFPADANQSGGFTRIWAEKGTDLHRFVQVAVFDEMKRGITPPETYLSFRAVRRFPKVAALWEKAFGDENTDESPADARTIQIQLYTDTYEPVSDDQREALDELFQGLRPYLLDAL